MSDPELFAALRQAKRDWKVSKKEYNKAYDRVDEAGDKHGRPSPQWHKQSRRADKYWKRTHWAEDAYLVYDAQVRSRGLY
ncbi:hypothetical protein ACFVWL_00150 [Microbacterium sp. NPDC058269]|uniref:hypothetical protein n=1 Tax=Microbacterium sp. NPDC058269 TaxID=3346414 RepID=UPI0036DC9885